MKIQLYVLSYLFPRREFLYIYLITWYLWYNPQKRGMNIELCNVNRHSLRGICAKVKRRNIILIIMRPTIRLIVSSRIQNSLLAQIKYTLRNKRSFNHSIFSKHYLFCLFINLFIISKNNPQKTSRIKLPVIERSLSNFKLPLSLSHDKDKSYFSCLHFKCYSSNSFLCILSLNSESFS